MAKVVREISGDTFNAIRDKLMPFLLSLAKSGAPVAKINGGTLKENIRIENGDDFSAIVMDIWYAVYTDMVWTYNRRWGKTLENPHEGWFTEDFINEAMSMIERILGSEVKRIG